MEDAQWRAESTGKTVTDYLQSKDPQLILEFLMELGLYEKLREASGRAAGS